jgi:hypothetical protein
MEGLNLHCTLEGWPLALVLSVLFLAAAFRGRR